MITGEILKCYQKNIVCTNLEFYPTKYILYGLIGHLESAIFRVIGQIIISKSVMKDVCSKLWDTVLIYCSFSGGPGCIARGSTDHGRRAALKDVVPFY